MHRYIAALLCLMLIGCVQASRHELSASLTIPMSSHEFTQSSYNTISSPVFQSTDVKHLETLEHFTISTGGISGDLSSHRFHSSNRHDLISSIQHTNINVGGVDIPHGTALHLSFQGLGETFNYHLEPMYGMISTDSKVEVHDANGVRELIPMKLQSYFLHTDDEWVSMTIHSDGTFSAVIRRSNEVYQIDPHHVHAEAMSSKHHYNTLAAASHHGMTIFRHSDLISTEEGGQKHMCGAVSQEGVAAHERGETIQQSHIHTHHSRSLLAVDPFNCGQPVGTSGYSGVSAGQVVDYGMYLRAGSPTSDPAQATVQKATDYVQSVYAMMNAVYAPQLKMVLQVATVQVETTADQTNKPWNVRPRVPGQRCELANGALRANGAAYSVTIDTTLNDFTAYVQTQKAGTMTFWHQMTNCYPPSGVVGIAYVNVMCTRLRSGVSTFSTTTWLTMAHEIAHNFGADHTFQLGQGRTGGIMDYGLNTFRGEVQFNIIYSKTQLCGGITAIAADPQGVRRFQGGVQPYCFAALNAAAVTGIPTMAPTTPTTAPATIRPTPPSTATTPYTLAQVATHRTATDCWVVIGTNVYQITRWCVTGKHPGGPIITSTCGTDATTIFNANHRTGATYLATLLAGDVIGRLVAATPAPPATVAPVTPRPVTPAPTTAPATPPPTTTPPRDGNQYFWAVTPFSACSGTCEGQQTRLVACVNGNNRNNLIVVPDTFCQNGAALNGARPASAQTCGNACPVRFVAIPGQTGTCQGATGATCSTMANTPGTRSQAVQCMKTQNGVDQVVADAVCITAGVMKPATNTACTLPICAAQFTWGFTAWSECSTQCGGGTQTRRVACVRVTVDAQTMKTEIAIANSATCQAMFGNPPPSTRACNTMACASNSQRYIWTITSNFTACSAPCNGGTQTRTAYCTDTYMNQIVPGYQCPNAPILSQGCNTQPCGVYVWVTGRTGPCDATCGPSSATRTVTCINQLDPMMTPVDSQLCLQSEKPSTTVPCQLAACPTGTTPAPTTPTTPPTSGLAVYALNTVATHAIPSDCWAVVENLVYNLSYFGQDPVIPGVSHPISGALINGICGTDATTVFEQTHRDGTLQLPLVKSKLIGKIGANTPDPVFPPPIGTGTFKWQIDQVGIQCGPTPVDKCTVTSASEPRCVNVGSKSLIPVDDMYCADQPDPTDDPTQPRVGEACPVDANNPNPCIKKNTASTRLHVLSAMSSQQPAHPLTRTTFITTAVSGTGPQWLAGNPSACTVLCGGGSQIRNVTCIDASTGVPLPLTSCDPTTKPDEILSCGTQSCSAFWSVGPWNECSEKCGGMGIQTRSVDCRSSASSNGLGMIQADATCLLTAAKPSTQQTCNALPCPKWVGGTWSECSEKCGVGTQTLQGVRCENQYGMVVDDNECVTSSQFNHQRPCNMGPCPVYDHGAWSPCSATCGGGNQTREVYCRTPNHLGHEGAIEYNMTICDMYDGDGRAKGNHVTQQSCNEQPCDDIYWKITGKSTCSAKCNGGALRVTSVCMKRNMDMTYSQVPDQICLNSTMLSKPTEVLDCNTQPCSNQYGWDPSPWSECSAYCGNGTQTREVTCIDMVTKVVSPGKCGANTQYATTRTCSEPVNKCWGNVRLGDMKTGECITDATNPLRGTCQCRSGWAGSDCSINPSITNVFFENTKYSMGIPVGVNEKIIIRWNSYGSNKDVSILLSRDDNSTFFVQYIARNIVNTGVYEWNVGSILDDIPFANKYVIQVMMKNTVFGRSATFQTADPCQYKACGMNAVCQAGKCQCQPGYTGPNCQISPCQRLGCDPLRSTCDNTAANPTCQCTDGWTGPRCKTPVSCVGVATCQNGGDYVHPIDMPVSKPLTCPLDDTDVTCDCEGYWTNSTCNVCGLQCMNGGIASKDCSTCTCAPGFTGPTCACKYYGIKATLNYDTSKWVSTTQSTSIRRFQQTFANDIAASVIGLSANQIIFTSFIPRNQQIDIEFQLTEQCGAIAPDLLMNENIARIAMAISGTTTGTLDNIYQQLLQQFRSTDSMLLQGYLTSSIVPGSVVVNDPTSTKQPEQPGTPTDPFGPAPTNNGVYAKSSSSSPLTIMLIGIIVGAIVGIILIVMGIIYFYKRHQASSQHTLNKVTTEGTTSQSSTPRGVWMTPSTRA